MPSDVLSLARFNVRIMLEVLSLDSFNERMTSVALSLVILCYLYEEFLFSYCCCYLLLCLLILLYSKTKAFSNNFGKRPLAKIGNLK